MRKWENPHQSASKQYHQLLPRWAFMDKKQQRLGYIKILIFLNRIESNGFLFSQWIDTLQYVFCFVTTASDLLVGMLLIENFFFNNFSYFHLFQSFHLISLTSVLSDSGTDGPWNLCLELEFREQGDSKFGK